MTIAMGNKLTEKFNNLDKKEIEYFLENLHINKKNYKTKIFN